MSVIDIATNTAIAACGWVYPTDSRSRPTVHTLTLRTDASEHGIVSVISTATNMVIATVSVGSFPLAVAVTPDGAFAYVTSVSTATDTGTVSVIDTATNMVSATTGREWAQRAASRSRPTVPSPTFK